MARGAALAEALGRLEERYRSGVVLPGGRAAEWRALRRVPFGVASLDALLEGGVVAGEPAALVGHGSTGTVTLAHVLVASAQSRGGEVAWLDPLRSFDPLAASRAGVDLARLLLVRAAGDALVFAAGILARSSAFVLIVLDLGASFAPVQASVAVLDATVARVRASGQALLVLGDRAPSRHSFTTVAVRRREWLRERGRIVGWRSLATRPHDDRAASLLFAPLALPRRTLVDEGVVELSRAEAVG